MNKVPTFTLVNVFVIVNSNAKVKEMIELSATFEKLNEVEAKKLSTLLREKQGNVNACKKATNLHANTLKRAAAGLEVKKVSAQIIREKLLRDQLQAA